MRRVKNLNFCPAGAMCRSGIALLIAAILGQAFTEVRAQQASLSASAQEPKVPSTSATVTSQSLPMLTRNEAVQLALAQASTFQQAKLNELIAAEDVRQARAAFLPQINSPSEFIYTSPAHGIMQQPGMPPAPSFIANNAVTEYLGVVGFSGELDLFGRLRATLKRNGALLQAAKAGTEVARRALVEAVDEAYYGFALAEGKRRSAELTLAGATEFERITGLMFNAGEVAQVDLARAHLQTLGRRDDLDQARANEAVAADVLKVLIGYDFTRPIETADLASLAPDRSEIDRFAVDIVSRRPELIQFDFQKRAADQEASIARAARRPLITYQVLNGIDTDSLHPDPLHEHSGVAATINITVPIFDWGISKSRENQARLRGQTVDSQRTVALRALTQQFYAARTQALTAIDRVQALRAALVDAERNLQTSIARYRAGEAPILEVTDATSTLASERTSFYQALFDYQIARARLAQAAGQ
jgi:outer membrane protein TolC